MTTVATVATDVARAGGVGVVDVRRMARAVAKAPAAAVTAMAEETAEEAVEAEARSTVSPGVRALLPGADLLPTT